MRRKRAIGCKIMYNYWCCNTIAISECVKNYKENLIFIDKELKMGENILLKNPD